LEGRWVNRDDIEYGIDGKAPSKFLTKRRRPLEATWRGKNSKEKGKGLRMGMRFKHKRKEIFHLRKTIRKGEAYLSTRQPEKIFNPCRGNKQRSAW